MCFHFSCFPTEKSQGKDPPKINDLAASEKGFRISLSVAQCLPISLFNTPLRACHTNNQPYKRLSLLPCYSHIHAARKTRYSVFWAVAGLCAVLLPTLRPSRKPGTSKNPMFSSVFRSFLLFVRSFAVLFYLPDYFSFRAGDFWPLLLSIPIHL